MSFGLLDRRLLVVVGAGGVGKTTLAAALGLVSAREGKGTLVMTFDPSLRLKDALGVGVEAQARETAVRLDAPAPLYASLLDARATFDALVRRYAPDEAVAARIFANRFYHHLAGTLAGVLEYMAVERLYEVARDARFARVILDTPPTRQALDFLEAPTRITAFLDSGALRFARRDWFDAQGRLRVTRLGPFGRGLATWLDRLVGLDLLRDMVEFFRAFTPLYAGFRTRADDVRRLLRARQTGFLLVAGPGEERIPDTLFFARRLREAGHDLRLIVVNQTHPELPAGAATRELGLLAWLGERDRRGLAALARLLGPADPFTTLPLLPETPTGLTALEALGRRLLERLPRARRSE